MGLVEFNGAIVSGNFSKLKKGRPKRLDKDYKALVPFDFKWRHKIGKVECTCTECEEHYQPYYGCTWYHSKDCAIMKLLEKRPQIYNLKQYWGQDLTMIACTD